MKKQQLILIILSLFPILLFGQIAHYNQFPAIQPTHLLDDKLDNISFALGMRILQSDYNGPLIKLRRASDNTTQDFFATDNDNLDSTEINIWSAGADLFVETLYDQSELNRHAIQTTLDAQPQFFPDPTKPYFKGDGVNDELIIGTSIQILTNAGVNGTVLTVLSATQKSQHTFGVLVGRDRWSVHTNWSNENLYFDPGNCCNTPRFYENSANVGVWNQYTFLKGTTTVTARQKGLEKFIGTHTTGRCTVNLNFAICHATGSNSGFSDTKITEMIMYNTDISPTVYSEIEEDQIAYWSL